jgi:hypothetical protein
MFYYSYSNVSRIHLVDKLSEEICNNLTLDNSKGTTCYLGPFINILLRKWFPLSRSTSPGMT